MRLLAIAGVIGLASVPATVTIPANQKSATFTITVGNDATKDGTQNVFVEATASGYQAARAVLPVRDND